MPKKALLTSTALLACLVVAGCGSSQDETSPEAPAATSASAPASSTTGASAGTTRTGTPSASAATADGEVDLSQHTFPVSWQDALKKAQDRFSGDVAKVELEKREGGGYEYKIELRSDTQKYAVQVDAESGKIVSEKTDDESDGDTERQEKSVDLDEVVDLDKAMDAAQQARSGAVTAWKIEGTSGGPQYEFDITDPQNTREDHEVQVDARSGKVTQQD